MNKKGDFSTRAIYVAFAIIIGVGIMFFLVSLFDSGAKDFSRAADLTIKLDNDALPYNLQANTKGMCPCDDEDSPRYVTFKKDFLDTYVTFPTTPGEDSTTSSSTDDKKEVPKRISSFDLETVESLFRKAKDVDTLKKDEDGNAPTTKNALSTTKINSFNDELESVGFKTDDSFLKICGVEDEKDCTWDVFEKQIVEVQEVKTERNGHTIKTSEAVLECFTTTTECRKEYADAYDKLHKK